MALRTVELELDGSSKRTRRAARHFSAGWAAQKERDWAEAIASYSRALVIDPTLFSAWANRGMCWHQISRPREALADYDRAWQVGTPELRGIIRVNRGVLLASVRRYDEALEDFASDQSFESRLNAAYIHLMRGDLERGLALYRERPTVRQWKTTVKPLSELAGKSVLILHEQGFGDSIQMARYVPQVAAVAKSVHWTTRTALLPLLAGNFPSVTFSDGGDVKAAALKYRHDETVLVMDLWQTCGLGIAGAPYLKADLRRVERMRALLPSGPKIGLSWRGRTEFANDHNRSAALKDFLPNIPGAALVSLQQDLTDDERALGVFDAGTKIKNFADSAVLMACLDAVITVDTATAHLAGALGVKTAILLPYHADWRWGPAGATTPWYASARLFRQPAFGAWAEPVAAAAAWCVAG